MKFVIDDKIPYIRGVFEPFGEVIYLPGKETTPEIVKDADGLITRTRTICNERLLKGSSVRYIATATIGFDHLDLQYCEQAGIQWSNAPGCNSGSVQQYIASVLMILAKNNNWNLREKTIGIVGVGHVGSGVERLCRLLGMRILLNDPPRARTEGSKNFVSLQTICEEADLISFHVPLNKSGIDKTFHMVDARFIEQLNQKPILLNTCRGEVFDTQVIKKALSERIIRGTVIDCWEHEPGIDKELVTASELISPHIAGYSKDGKANGTTASVRAISRFFHLGIDNWEASGVGVPDQTIIELDGFNVEEQELLAKAIIFTYDIRQDDQRLRNRLNDFEQLRGNYPLRREFPVYTIKGKNLSKDVTDKFKQLGFQIAQPDDKIN